MFLGLKIRNDHHAGAMRSPPRPPGDTDFRDLSRSAPKHCLYWRPRLGRGIPGNAGGICSGRRDSNWHSHGSKVLAIWRLVRVNFPFGSSAGRAHVPEANLIFADRGTPWNMPSPLHSIPGFRNQQSIGLVGTGRGPEPDWKLCFPMTERSKLIVNVFQ